MIHSCRGATWQADHIDEEVETGAYASGSEVIGAGLRAPQERDATVERRLREEVARTYGAVMAKRRGVFPTEEAQCDLALERLARLSS